MCAQRRLISLGIRPVWSESSLSAWRKLGSLVTHWVHTEYSDQPGHPLDQTGWMPRLIRVFAGRSHFVGFGMRWLNWHLFGCYGLVFRGADCWPLVTHCCFRLGSNFIRAATHGWVVKDANFSTQKCSSSHCCGLEPSSVCGWSGSFSRGSPVFIPPCDWLGSK